MALCAWLFANIVQGAHVAQFSNVDERMDYYRQSTDRVAVVIMLFATMDVYCVINPYLLLVCSSVLRKEMTKCCK